MLSLKRLTFMIQYFWNIISEGENMSILCIDNSETIRKIVKDCVEDLHFDFFEAENGKIGIEKVQGIKELELIILDWNMPVMSGRETLIKLREQLGKVKILVLIKFENKNQVMDAVDLGATNYMLKPFSVNALQNKIEEMMKNAD